MELRRVAARKLRTRGEGAWVGTMKSASLLRRLRGLAERPIWGVLWQCDCGVGYAVTDRINRVAAAAADNRAALALYELVRGRLSVGALADSGLSIFALDDPVVFRGATFIRRALGFDSDRRVGGGAAHRHFAHALSTASYC